MMIEDIKKELNGMATEKLRDFQSRLIPNSLPILGVKIPDVRKLAKRLCREEYHSFLIEYDESSFEIELLYAFVIAQAKMDFSSRISYLKAFIPRIRDWAICDCLVASLKCTKQNPELMLAFLKEYQKSTREYEVRFVAVMLLSYYLNDEYVVEAVNMIQSLDCTTYYAKMGVAWFIATLMIQYKEEAFAILKSTRDTKLIQMTIRKVRDSYRISKEDKELILKLKR